MYGPSYFGVGRDPGDRGGLSGYESYDRKSSLGERLAFTLWQVFVCERVLDIGCALGYLVEAFRDLGVDAEGVDFSPYAVEHCTPSVRDHVRRGDLLQGLAYPDSTFDLVTAIETLEHLPPEEIPRALREMRRITRGYAVATIPAFGPNVGGPNGWFEGKVRPNRLRQYESLPPDYDGPVPYEDLIRDTEGRPMEGHLTIASYHWWKERFSEAGFERSTPIEQRIYPCLERFGLKGFLCLFVMKAKGAPSLPERVRSDEELDEVERRWDMAAYEPARA